MFSSCQVGIAPFSWLILHTDTSIGQCSNCPISYFSLEVHFKKRKAIFPSPSGMSLEWHPGGRAGTSLTFFYNVLSILRRSLSKQNLTHFVQKMFIVPHRGIDATDEERVEPYTVDLTSRSGWLSVIFRDLCANFVRSFDSRNCFYNGVQWN